MAIHQSKSQRETVERVMHEYKEGELKTGGGKGPKVKSRKQAVAIALHESGSTNQESSSKNRKALSRTKGKERRGETAEAETEGKRAQDRTLAKGGNGGRAPGEKTKTELYAQAKKRNISGRSTMSKAQLQRALGH